MHKQRLLLAATVTVAALLTPIIPAAYGVQSPVREQASTVLDTLVVTAQQQDMPGYSQNSFRYPQARKDLGAKANQWDYIYQRDFNRDTIQISDDGDVLYGELDNDPYSGQQIIYKKGDTSSVDIEHVVARSEAWDSGAYQWTQEQRDVFANDPLELIAVDSSMNRSHGEKDAANWLPSHGNGLFPHGNPSYDCKYVARQIAVKAKYKLTVDQAEKTAMQHTLASCPDQTLPIESDGAYWDDGHVMYSKQDLKQVTATYDGKPIQGFDPINGGRWTVADVKKLGLPKAPDGWSASTIPTTCSNANGSACVKQVTVTITSPDDTVRVSYVFMETQQSSPEPSRQHVVTLIGDGLSSSTVRVDDGVTIGDLKTPQRDGYRFLGWLHDGKLVESTLRITKDMTLTASWQPVIKSDTNTNADKPAHDSTPIPQPSASDPEPQIPQPTTQPTELAHTGASVLPILIITLAFCTIAAIMIVLIQLRKAQERETV